MPLKNTYFLPKKKTEFITRQYENIPDDIAQLKVVEYSNATIIALGYVVDACNHPKENRIIDDLDLCADITCSDEAATVDDCTVLYCGYLHHNAWGHFITNTLSRMWPIACDDYAVDKYIFLTTNDIDLSEIQGNFAEIFRLLGIEDKVEIVKQPKSFKKILVGDLSFMLDYKVYPEYVNLIELIRSRALDSVVNPYGYRPIFLSRSALKKKPRRDIGIDIIDDFYRANGFDIVYPEQICIVELIQRLAVAPISVFISGSGAHNSIFCPQGKEVHIIERSAICNIFQPIIEDAFSHKVVYIEASYTLLPVPYGYGPFLYSVTEHLERYASEYGYSLPPKNHRQSHRNFKTYLKIRNRRFRYRWWIDGWADSQLELFLEAYNRAKIEYSEFLGGAEAMYVSPLKGFAKKIIKSLLQRK